MAYFLVLVIAAAAGVAVAYSTLRTGAATVAQGSSDAWTRTYEPVPAEEELESAVETVPAGAAQSRHALPTDPTTHTRVVGVLGLAIAVLIAAGALVGAFYVGVVVLKRAFA